MEGSFEAIADGWDAHAADRGDIYHRHLILPALEAALGPVQGRRVLDLGCGNGVLSRALAGLGAHVTGVDIAPTLIVRARRREAQQPLGITYLVADAAQLSMLADGTFERVTANTVLMDARDATAILRETARLLVSGGRFVASLLHPCFEVPGHSDWATEDAPAGERLMRRVWRYREAFSTLDYLADDQPVPITRYHRPLCWYAASLREVGLLIDTLDEPAGDEVLAREKPRSAQLRRVAPSFLILGATKVCARSQ
jgi:ubiquinone/menaquinone biosynthesis C-methylase UbiE